MRIFYSSFDPFIRVKHSHCFFRLLNRKYNSSCKLNKSLETNFHKTLYTTSLNDNLNTFIIAALHSLFCNSSLSRGFFQSRYLNVFVPLSVRLLESEALLVSILSPFRVIIRGQCQVQPGSQDKCPLFI